MSLLGSLEASSEWREACRGLDPPPVLADLAPYVVRDIPVERVDAGHAILLLESPHTLETCCGFPLAGASGLAVADHLGPALRIPGDQPKCPLGDILRNHRYNDRLRRLGVMNVSELPMQSTAYPSCPKSDFEDLFLRHLAAIRATPRATTRRGSRRRLREKIDALLVERLKSRVERTCPNALWVLCGDVAEAFFDKAGLRESRHEVIRVGHPSYNGWAGGQATIVDMKRRVAEQLE